MPRERGAVGMGDACAKDDEQATRSGLGDGAFGVTWRLVDEEKAGHSLSTYPQYTRDLLTSSSRRGIASPGRSFFLPLVPTQEVPHARFPA